MEAVVSAVEAPVAGGPEGSRPGSCDPDSGDPVVAGGSVTPVAGRPHVVRVGCGRLVVGGELRRRLVGGELIHGGLLLRGDGLAVVVVGGRLLGLILVLLILILGILILRGSLVVLRGRASLLGLLCALDALVLDV